MLSILFLLALANVAQSRFDDPDPIVPCNMNSCFNLQRCKKGFSIYIYPTPSGQESPSCYKCTNMACQKTWYQACFAYTILTSGFTITEKPEEACLLVTPFDLCPGNHCDDKRMAELDTKMRRLPYWNDGRNHIVWNYWTDWPSPGFDVGKAVVVSASFVNQTYRPFYDVALPLSRMNFRDPEPSVLNLGWNLRSIPEAELETKAMPWLKEFVKNRTMLLYFKGSIPAIPRKGICEHRSRIFGRYFVPPVNISDVHIEATCMKNHTGRAPHLRVAHCDNCFNNRRTIANGNVESCTAAWPNLPYEDGLTRARFAFAPRGCGSQSFRILEAIGFGAVPVISGWGSFPSFANEGPIGRLYERCVVQVREEDLGSLIPQLRAMPEKEYFARLAACIRIATFEGQQLKVLSRQAVCYVAARVAAALNMKGGLGTWGNPRLVEMCQEVGVVEEGVTAEVSTKGVMETKTAAAPVAKAGMKGSGVNTVKVQGKQGPGGKAGKVQAPKKTLPDPKR